MSQKITIRVEANDAIDVVSTSMDYGGGNTGKNFIRIAVVGSIFLLTSCLFAVVMRGAFTGDWVALHAVLDVILELLKVIATLVK